MKMLVLGLVAFMLMMGTLQTNAERLTLVERQLLSEANFGGKFEASANKKADYVDGIKGIQNTGTASDADQKNTDDDESEVNHGFGKFGNPSGAGSDTHHHYIGDRRPGGGK